MIENIFRTINWKRLYRIALWSQGLGSAFLLFFWLWHRQYTGDVALGVSGYPRIFDSIGLIVWIFVIVFMAHAVRWIVLFPSIATYDARFKYLDWLRRFFAVLLFPVLLGASVVTVFETDILTVARATTFAFVAYCFAFVSTGAMIWCLNFLWTRRQACAP